jgi:hypothetical protein
MKKPKLGDWVVVNHKLVREKMGLHYSWKIVMLPKPLYVCVVGTRTIGNGFLTKNKMYVHREQKKAYLVAKDLRSTFYVYL